MLEFGIATLILIVTILVGFPIAYSIGLTTIFYIFITNPANLLVIPIRMFSGINSFTLMALPLFMLAAEIMVRTGISSKLFDFVRITRVGKWRGGLAYVNVLASTIFGSISGAALSDIAGLGKVEIDAMEEDGYEKGFACAITAGLFTPTEAAAVAVLYALIVGAFVFKNITVKMILDSLWSAGKTTANLFVITSISAVFAWAIGVEQIPQQLSAFMLGITDSPYVMLLIINVILIIVGMWMETSAAVLLFAPILAPIAVAMGVHPVHFAVVMIVNLTIGLITPPVGVVLYATSNVGKLKFEQVVKSAMPLILLAVVILLLVTFIPELSLFLPRLLGFID